MFREMLLAAPPWARHSEVDVAKAAAIKVCGILIRARQRRLTNLPESLVISEDYLSSIRKLLI